MKRLFSLVLGTCLALVLIIESGTTAVKAAGWGDAKIDKNKASVIALLFVLDNLDKEKWNETTTISSFKEMMDDDGDVNAYCFGLKTKEASSGYVVVSAKPSAHLILEFAKEGLPPYFDEKGALPCKNTSGTIYYLGGLAFTDDITVASKVGNQIQYSDSTEKENRQLLDRIGNEWDLQENENGVILYAANDGANNEITNPVVYLNNRYGTGTYTYQSGGSIYMYNYSIPDTNGCTLAALAAVMHARQTNMLGTNTTFNSIYNQVKSVAIWDNSDGSTYWTQAYGVDVNAIAPLANEVLDWYGSTWTAHSYLLGAFSRARSEIQAGRASCLNIAFGYYGNHSVGVMGYRTYTKGSSTYSLLEVRDGWHQDGSRFVDMTGITVSTIVTITP